MSDVLDHHHVNNPLTEPLPPPAREGNELLLILSETLGHSRE